MTALKNHSGQDTTAFHATVAAEISAVTEKAVVAADDLLLSEDSAAANVKKRVLLGNIFDLILTDEDGNVMSDIDGNVMVAE